MPVPCSSFISRAVALTPAWKVGERLDYCGLRYTPNEINSAGILLAGKSAEDSAEPISITNSIDDSGRKFEGSIG